MLTRHIHSWPGSDKDQSSFSAGNSACCLLFTVKQSYTWFTPRCCFLNKRTRIKGSISSYLIEAEAEQEQQHVDDFICNQLSSKGDHDEHPSTHVDPVFGVAAHHFSSQNFQHWFTFSHFWQKGVQETEEVLNGKIGTNNIHTNGARLYMQRHPMII